MSHSSEPRSPAKRLLIAVLALAASMLLLTACQNDDKTPIKVGVLHSLTGTMAISEQPVVDATLLAIEEINARGGLLGRKIVPVIVDGKSDWPTFAREAERLIIAEKVSAIFGCWTSASRKSVKPVVEKHQNILFYPVQYEGLEQSTNIIYGGQSANQQIIPAVKWSLNHLGKRFFLVGSDYIFPYIANAIITDQLTAMGVKVAGEAYLPLGSSDTQPLIDIIIAAKPDVILNTINGDSNIAFFKALRAAGISSDKIPTLSFSIAEPEAQQLGGLIAGDYASWSYFQTIDSPENSAFVSRFKARYGNQRVISDPMQAAYTNVMIWADTVSAIDSSTPVSVLSNIKHQHRNTATGIVYQDQMNNHRWKRSRIGKARADGQFDIVWQSEHPIEPVPYPLYRTNNHWRAVERAYYDAWGGNWQHPGSAQIQSALQAAAEAKRTLALMQKNDTLILAAVEASLKRSTDDEIRAIEGSWKSLPVNAPIMLELLTGRSAQVLKQFQQQHPRLSEIFITDAHGLMLGMTSKTSDFYQADEQWWSDTYSGGAGETWQGQIEFDESSGTWGIPLYLPVKAGDGKVIAIIKAFVDIGDLIPSTGATP